MEPVLAIPCINRPDLLRRLIDSIDIPVRLLVIDNGAGVHDVIPEDAWLLEPPTNLGIAASWNLAIKCYPQEPFWLIANADIELAPGDLQRLIEDPRGWVGVNDWQVFKLTADVVEAVGWFDENYVPAYCEDADYERRCSLAGVPWGFIPGETSHVGSVCLQDHGRANTRTYPDNVRYHLDKWGVGVRAGGGYTTPFDRGGSVADGTQPHLSRLRANAWTHRDG